MLVNFSFQNFGSIKDKQTLSFEATKSSDLSDIYIIEPIKNIRLLKLGLIFGANASGKTTILKALDFFRSIVVKPFNNKNDVFDYETFLFDKNTPSQNSIFSIEFVQNKIKYYYEVELNKNSIAKEILNFYNPNKANVYKRTTDLKKQLTKIEFGSKIKIDNISKKSLETNTLWNNTVLGGFLKTNVELQELQDASDWFAKYIKPLVYLNTELDSFITDKLNQSKINKDKLVNLLKKADFNISDVIIKKEEKEITADFLDFLEKQIKAPIEKIDELKKIGKITSIDLEFEHTIDNNKYKLPFELESEGTKKYYGLAGLLDLSISSPSLFPIDELESSIHPDLYLHFLLTFLTNTKESQIIATTHNREILNNKDIFRNDVIWFTDKNNHCATELYSLSDFGTNVIRETSNVYNAYKIGKLGAVPNLKDYYLDTKDEKN